MCAVAQGSDALYYRLLLRLEGLQEGAQVAMLDPYEAQARGVAAN